MTHAHAQVKDGGMAASKGWRRQWLNRLWYVDMPVIMLVRAVPSLCLEMLITAAMPSTYRLHHRNLFAHGRRYQVETQDRGFLMTTTSKVSWHHRRRTRAYAVMVGVLDGIGDELTRIELESHINLWRLLEFALLPTFMTSILVFVPWNPLVIFGVIVLMYGLSWVAFRYNAALDANEMVFFVQKALEDLEPAELFALAARPDLVVDAHDFASAWERFYQRQANNNNPQPPVNTPHTTD